MTSGIDGSASAPGPTPPGATPRSSPAELESYRKYLPKLTPLGRAVFDGDAARVKELIPTVADVTHAEKGVPSPFGMAVGLGRDDLVRMFLDAGANARAYNSQLVGFAASRGYTAIVTALVKAGAPPDAPTQSRWTPLEIAVHRNDLATLDALIALGANVNRQSAQGFTALSSASQSGRETVIERLIAAGADVNGPSDALVGPLASAAAEGRLSVVARLLAAGASTTAAAKSWTPLGAAAARGHVAVISQLLAAGADPDAASLETWTPLTLGAFHGHAQVLRVLLAAGAEVDKRDKNDRTALMWASWREFRRCYDILVAAGADRAARSMADRGPHDVRPVPLISRSFKRPPMDPLPLRILPRLMVLGATRRVISGLRVAVDTKKDQRQMAFQAMEKALRLVDAWDPHEFKRMQTLFRRIVVGDLPAMGAGYMPSIEWCFVNWDPKAKVHPTPEEIASLLVHEVTHARLLRMGFGYQERERLRIERACSRAALRFSRKLPTDGGKKTMRDHLKWLAPDSLSDRGLRESALRQMKEMKTSPLIVRAVDWWLRRREAKAKGQ